MIELNKKTQQDFLNREWVQKLLDAGVSMSDAKYYIGNWTGGGETQNKDIVFDKYKTKFVDMEGKKVIHWRTAFKDVIPTYTVSELLYKLREKQGIYTIFNNLRNNDIDNTPIIESLVSLLIQCHQKDIGIATKDTGDISDK